MGGVRASAALFSHLSTFCKGGICEAVRGARAGRGSVNGRAVVRRCSRASAAPCSGRGTQNCRQRRYASELPPSTYSKSWKVGFARRSEARARARCARWAGGGAGSDARLPLRETRARPRAPERLVCEGVGCGAGCGTRCGALTPARPREGTRRSLVAAPAVAQYPGGGPHKPLLAARARPVPREGGGRRLIAPQRPLPTHCLAVPAFQKQQTRFAAGTATINRESRRNSREEVGTS